MKPPIKKEKPRERALSPEEIRTLWEVLSTAPEKQRYGKGIARGEKVLSKDDLSMTRATALTLLLSLATGQRIGEVAGIAKAEVDLNDTAPIWVVPVSARRTASLTECRSLVWLCHSLRKPRSSQKSEWLFPSARGEGPIDPHGPNSRARPST